MQSAVFSIVPYGRQQGSRGWPAPADDYSAEVAQSSMQRALEHFEVADQLGFDWVTVAEHHFSPASLTPNPMVMAGAVAQRVKRAKIALLGSNVPIQNPVRVAEEFAMLDTLTGGRLIAGMLRGTTNEYVTYGVNPAESRERFAEALDLIVRAWTEPQPFGWLGRYYEYRTISIWAPLASARGHAGGLRISTANPAADEAAARAGYYGRDTERQRSRLQAGGDIDERIETAQLLLGSPATVLAQVDRLRRELGVGIVELAFIAPGPDLVRRSLELFGTEVLPRMHEL